MPEGVLSRSERASLRRRYWHLWQLQHSVAFVSAECNLQRSSEARGLARHGKLGSIRLLVEDTCRGRPCRTKPSLGKAPWWHAGNCCTCRACHFRRGPEAGREDGEHGGSGSALHRPVNVAKPPRTPGAASARERQIPRTSKGPIHPDSCVES